METWDQISSVIATMALLLGSGAGFAYVRMGSERTPRFRSLPGWGWRAGTLVGVGALAASIILGNVTTDASLLSSATTKAAIVALIASFLYVATVWRDLIHHEREPVGWASLVPVAVVAGISVFPWPVEAPPTPLLSILALVAAGFGLWSAGQGLDVLTAGQAESRSSGIAFGALTLNVAAVVGINWRVWGMPAGIEIGDPSSFSGALSLLAVWLISAAALILRPSSVKLASALNMIGAALLVGISLIVHWTLPFN